MSRAEGKKHTKLKAIQIECKSALARAVGAALGIASGRSVGATHFSSPNQRGRARHFPDYQPCADTKLDSKINKCYQPLFPRWSFGQDKMEMILERGWKNTSGWYPLSSCVSWSFLPSCLP